MFYARHTRIILNAHCTNIFTMT